MLAVVTITSLVICIWCPFGPWNVMFTDMGTSRSRKLSRVAVHLSSTFELIGQTELEFLSILSNLTEVGVGTALHACNNDISVHVATIIVTTNLQDLWCGCYWMLY